MIRDRRVDFIVNDFSGSSSRQHLRGTAPKYIVKHVDSKTPLRGAIRYRLFQGEPAEAVLPRPAARSVEATVSGAGQDRDEITRLLELLDSGWDDPGRIQAIRILTARYESLSMAQQNIVQQSLRAASMNRSPALMSAAMESLKATGDSEYVPRMKRALLATETRTATKAALVQVAVKMKTVELLPDLRGLSAAEDPGLRKAVQEAIQVLETAEKESQP
jgi:hypothetical protein